MLSFSKELKKMIVHFHLVKGNKRLDFIFTIRPENKL